MSKTAKTVAEPYAEWIQKLKDCQGGRPGYKDQTVGSLRTLVELAREYKPDRVIEIGTSYGASTRAWLEAGVPQVTCIDLTFGALEASRKFLALDMNRLSLFQQSIGDFPLRKAAAECQRPLVFFDCHGADNMRYVLGQLSGLSGPYCFAVDDMWYSPDKLDEWECLNFCHNVVELEIDTSLPKSLWPQSFANYWQGGAFYSFDEVVPLLQHVNARQIELQHATKEAWWVQE